MIKIFKTKGPNLFTYINKQSKKIEEKLSTYEDLELIEKFPHWWKSRKHKFTLTAYWGKPIWHIKSNNDKFVSFTSTAKQSEYEKNEVYLWHKLVIRGNKAEENLKNILKKLNLKPFKDAEHFPNGFHYNGKTKTVSCYVNLDFPEGFTQTENKNNFLN